MRIVYFISLVVFFLAHNSPIVQASEKLQPGYYRAVEKNAEEQYKHFELKFRQFIQIVDASLELRRDAKLLFKALHQILSDDDHLSSKDQQTLKRKLAIYRKNYEDLEQLTSAFRRYSNKDLVVMFPVNSPSTYLKELTENFGLKSNQRIIINPHDDFGRLMVLEIKMWLAAKLIILDNYAVVLSRYLKKANARRQFSLDTIDPGAKDFLEKVNQELHDEENYRRLIKTIHLVQLILIHEKENPNSDLARDKDNSYLNTLIEGSYAFHRIPQLTFVDKASIEFASLRNAFLDEIMSLGDKATFQVSELFGNAIGLYEERKGKLHKMSLEGQKKIINELHLLDILFEKTPFRLTDRFIPGHWGHVAIWVGDRSDIPELKRLGVWRELPRIEADARLKWNYRGPSFQSLIATNHGVLEALRPGVELNTFKHFLNIDDLAVIRNGRLTDKQKKYYLLRAFAQLGKEYDFNFDVETHKRIVCSELAYVVYDDYNWPVEQNIGRYTVSPDHVAALALNKDDPFLPVLIFHDGKELPKIHNRKNFKLLMDGAYDKVVY